MTKLSTTVQDGVREACIRARFCGAEIARRTRERAREERGQTAAEYMGVLLLVALVVAALVTEPVDIDAKISNGIKKLVEEISTGQKPCTGKDC